MYSKILVAFDGSSHAENALKSAISLLKDRESLSRLTVVYVQHSMIYVAPDAGFLPALDNMKKALDEDAQRVLELAKSILDDSSITYDAKMLVGDPAHEVCKVAERENYDLIVMGSRGMGLVAEISLGSVSHKVVHATNKPVLIVK